MYMYNHHVQYGTMYMYMQASCPIWNHVHVHASIMYNMEPCTCKHRVQYGTMYIYMQASCAIWNHVHLSIVYNMEPCTCTCKHHVQYGTMYMYHTVMPAPGAVLV